jgi:glycosyltransferase involved in cell wall biosynthesis
MISICMSYYNRKPQLLKTLESIKQSAYTDYEVIILDDGSADDHRLEDVEGIQLIRIEPEDKSWVNPSVPYNITFSKAKGDIVIIQNPECMHAGDILSYTVENLRKYNYLAFGCLSWDQTEIDLEKVPSITYPSPGQCMLGWYHHSKINCRPYHFCSAIMKSNLDKLRGFDERLAKGLCYDDDDFVRRIQKLGLSIKNIDTPYVIHQWHNSEHIYQTDSHSLFLDNQKLYGQILSGELPSWS